MLPASRAPSHDDDSYGRASASCASRSRRARAANGNRCPPCRADAQRSDRVRRRRWRSKARRTSAAFVSLTGLSPRRGTGRCTGRCVGSRPASASSSVRGRSGDRAPKRQSCMTFRRCSRSSGAASPQQELATITTPRTSPNPPNRGAPTRAKPTEATITTTPKRSQWRREPSRLVRAAHPASLRRSGACRPPGTCDRRTRQARTRKRRRYVPPLGVHPPRS